MKKLRFLAALLLLAPSLFATDVVLQLKPDPNSPQFWSFFCELRADSVTIQREPPTHFTPVQKRWLTNAVLNVDVNGKRLLWSGYDLSDADRDALGGALVQTLQRRRIDRLMKQTETWRIEADQKKQLAATAESAGDTVQAAHARQLERLLSQGADEQDALVAAPLKGHAFALLVSSAVPTESP